MHEVMYRKRDESMRIREALEREESFDLNILSIRSLFKIINGFVQEEDMRWFAVLRMLRGLLMNTSSDRKPSRKVLLTSSC